MTIDTLTLVCLCIICFNLGATIAFCLSIWWNS